MTAASNVAFALPVAFAGAAIASARPSPHAAGASGGAEQVPGSRVGIAVPPISAYQIAYAVPESSTESHGSTAAMHGGSAPPRKFRARS